MYPTINMPADDGIQDLLTTMASGCMPATSEVSCNGVYEWLMVMVVVE